MATKYTREFAEEKARSRGCQDKVMILGFRGKDSQFGHYDDILALLTPDSYTEWTGNTLPTKWEFMVACLVPGDYRWAKGLHGVHHYDDILNKLGKAKRDEVEQWLLLHEGQDHEPLFYTDDHGQKVKLILPYWAFRQAGPMSVIRHKIHMDVPEMDSWPNAPFWIDGHCGGVYTTSSKACQTWEPAGWLAARKAGYAAMDAYKQDHITYGLHLID